MTGLRATTRGTYRGAGRVKDEVLVCDLRYKRPTQTQRAFHLDVRVFLWPP